MTQDCYDALVIGGGPAGLTAAIYALRAKLDVLLIEKTGEDPEVRVLKLDPSVIAT